ncbi:hypothetical protein [Microbacterium sp. 69-10]|uniref:hypothetical protein n=1 Tax=Microbacterium sp. 69-10 TaxID=1895783 RepID=UPI0025E333ED|nr:hypothetical protein [Microbacterium sp. 69-10]
MSKPWVSVRGLDSRTLRIRSNPKGLSRMYMDPMGAILIHRIETDQNQMRAERRRVIAERDAERRGTDEGAQHAPPAFEGDTSMAKHRPFRFAS